MYVCTYGSLYLSFSFICQCVRTVWTSCSWGRRDANTMRGCVAVSLKRALDSWRTAGPHRGCGCCRWSCPRLQSRQEAGHLESIPLPNARPRSRQAVRHVADPLVPKARSQSRRVVGHLEPNLCHHAHVVVDQLHALPVVRSKQYDRPRNR